MGLFATTEVFFANSENHFWPKFTVDRSKTFSRHPSFEKIMPAI
jgi:hypothetical protein